MIKIIQEKVYRFILKLVDFYWEMSGKSYYEDYPPSFYYLYTPEERRRIIEEDNKRLWDLLEDL